MRPIVLLLLAGCPDAPPPGDLPLPEDFAPAEGEFLVVVLPDTQIYAESFPATFDSQLRWVADWAETYRIVFVSHVGDIVNTGSDAAQWDVAAAAYDWLVPGDVPHGFSPAGHDISMSGVDPSEFDATCSNFAHLDCGMTRYLERFGPQHYADRAWYAGSSPSGHSSYQRVSAEGLELLFLHLPQDARRSEVDWAHEVLDANPGTVAHVTTHRYLFDYRLTWWLPSPLNLLTAGRFNDAIYTLGGQDLMFTDSVKAEELFDELIAAHPNIWGVHCGHVDAEFRQSSVNAAGLPVYETLVDFQDMADGGGGWLRVLKFSPARERVEVVTFSTLTGEVRENGDGFDHSISILEAYKGEAIDILKDLGMDIEELEALLLAVSTPGSPEREAYYDSLYGDGERDSRFGLDVDFHAYAEASR